MTTQQPEALLFADDRPTSILHQWAMDAESVIRAKQARIAELEAALVKEAERTASEKRRADQMSQQHDMQAALNRDAREQLAEMAAQAKQGSK
jgi:arginine deiminase